MISISKSARVPYTTDQMYELVNDVESYPRFLPWCAEARVLARSSESLTATLKLAKGPLRFDLTTQNTMEPGRRVDMKLVSGPFRKFAGTWRFEPLPDQGCAVVFDLGFQFANALLGAALGRAFNEVANSLVDAFCARARERYGPAPRN